MSFLPVDWPENRFGQIHAPIQKDPYINAALKDFKPAQPFKLPVANLTLLPDDDVKFPTLVELNVECFQWGEGEEDLVYLL